MQIYKYSLLTSCIYLAITSTNQSLAACNNYAPDSGQIVLCDDSSPNPSLTPITSKDDAINVNVEIVEGSEIKTDQAAALTLGDASKITNAGKIVGITGVALRQGTSILNNSGTIIGSTGAGVVFNGSGNNTLINSGTIGSSTGNAIIFGAGSDNLVLNGGLINGGILQGDGADKANISNGIINGSLSQGNGIDDFLMSGGTLGSLQQGDGRDTFTMTGGNIIGAFEDGDVAKMTGGKIGRVDMKLDNNIFDMSGGEIVNNLVTGFGNDRIIVSGDSVIGGNVSVSGGTDSLTITGGTIKGEVRMSAGNDLFHWEEGIILGNVLMGSDNDRVEFTNLDEISASSSPLIDGGEGDDTLVMDNSQYTHSDANILQGIEHIYLKNGSVLTLNKRLLSLGDSSDDNLNTGFDIDSTSYLVVENSNKTAFNSHLSGAGTISTNTDGNSFNFTSNNEKDNFKGILALGNSTFDLSGLNTSALAQATLKASADSITTVGTGQQNIGGLVFDGGTIDFGSIALGNTLSDRSIQIRGGLNLNGSGVVKIGMESMVNVHPIIPNNVGLLSQDDVNTAVKLVASDGLVIGNGGSLILKDKEDRIITDNISNDILQNGLAVAMGTWDWRLTSGENRDGLYVAYALKQIDLEGAGENALILNSDGATGNASDLSARVTGSGSLAIENDANTIISLSNKKNDYTGVTDIRSGDLLMNNDNVLGNTSLLQMNADTSLDMNGFSQEIGSIDSSQNSQININEGDLKIDFGGSVLGHLIGDGLLTLKNGSLSIFGENNSFKAGTNILSNAIVNLNSSSGLGVSNIDNAGFLNLNNSDGNLINKLSNTGEVSLVSSDIILKGDNSKFNGTFSIDKDSQLTAKIPEHLGSAAIKNAGIINISPSSSWILNNSISGTGDFVKDGFGTVTLTPASATYTGKTNIQQGSIAFGSRSQQFKLETSEVNINQGSFSGNGSVAGDINNNSLLQVGNNSLIQNNSTQRLGGGETAINVDTLIVGRNVANNGIIQIGQTGTSAQAGNILAINGNYSSNGGTIVFNTVLGSDNSETDHMLVKGDSSGVTYVSVKNIGGSGAKTLDGIELINIAGKSEGEFQQKGRIVAGAFDYRLGRGVEINQKNWYLTNNTEEPAKPEDPTAPGEPTTPTNPGEPSEPGEPTTPTNPGEPSEPEEPTNPTNPGEPSKPEEPTNPTNPGEPTNPSNPSTPPSSTNIMYRPEAGTYINNLAAANSMFTLRLHDRLGETQYTDVLTGERKVTSLWLRQVGTHNAWRSDVGTLKTTSNQYVVMLGGDIAKWSKSGLDRGHLGLMAGYGNNQSKTHSNLTRNTSRGHVDGYSVGMYGTWYENETDKTGVYLDSWAQYSWFKNTVNGEGLSQENYNSQGLTASLESGYTLKVNDFRGSEQSLYSIYIQPKAQATWSGIKTGTHTENNGTRVSSDGDGNFQTRLGTRIFLKGHSKLDDGKDREFEPFVEINWLHNTRTYSTKMNNVKVSQDGARNVGEVGTGLEGQISRNITAWGNIGQQIGDSGYSNTKAMLGVKYSW